MTQSVRVIKSIQDLAVCGRVQGKHSEREPILRLLRQTQNVLADIGSTELAGFAYSLPDDLMKSSLSCILWLDFLVVRFNVR